LGKVLQAICTDGSERSPHDDDGFRVADLADSRIATGEDGVQFASEPLDISYRELYVTLPVKLEDQVH
jgi:hypothetical protein